MAESSPAPDQPDSLPSSPPASPQRPELRVVRSESQSPPQSQDAEKPLPSPDVLRVVPRPRISHLGLTRSDQLLLGTIATVIGLLLAAHWALLSNWGTQPVEVERVEPQPLNYQIDVNTATRLELMQLDGIGEMLAERIIADRDRNGPFADVDDLRRVKGIGPKTVEKMRPYVRIGK